MTAPGSVPPPAPGWWVKRNRVVFPPPATLTLTGFPPNLHAGAILTPAPASMTLTGFAPTVLPGKVLTPTKALLALTGFAPTIAIAPAALSIVGTPGAANTNTITLPTHGIGDIIVIFAYAANSTTIPTKPSAGGTVPAWVDIDTTGGTDGCAARTAYFVATATNHTSGTWTTGGSGATSMAVIVLRSQDTVSPIGGHALVAGTVAGQAVAPAVTLVKTDGTSMILEFYGQNGGGSLGAWDAAPTGYTRQAAVNSGVTRACLNTKNSTTTDGSVTQTGTTALFTQGYQGATIEIRKVGGTNNPSGQPVPTGNLSAINGGTFTNIFWDDFTLDAPIGSWANPSDPNHICYTGAQGQQWRSYPQTYTDTYQHRPYRSDAVLSVSNSCLDFYLHNVDGIPAGANPSPIIAAGSQNQTYGRYSARLKLDTNTLSEYHAAWLLWPASENWPTDGEDDFPEGQLSSTVGGFHHYARASGEPHQDVASVPGTVIWTDWHTYTIEWMPGRTRYVIDDVTVALDTTNFVPIHPMRWQLQTETNGTGTHTGHLTCDWVSVWSYSP